MKLRSQRFGAPMFADHNPSLCFVDWCKYGTPCAACGFTDDTAQGPFTGEQTVARAQSQVGKPGIHVDVIRPEDGWEKVEPS